MTEGNENAIIPKMSIPQALEVLDSGPAALTSSQRIPRRWLPAARVGWLVLAVLAIGFYLASLPTAFVYLQTPCASTPCLDLQLTPANVAALQAQGISTSFYATYFISLFSLVALVYTAIAGLIFWRQSADPMALFGSLTLLLFGTAVANDAPSSALVAVHPALWLPVHFIQALGEVSFVFFLYLFPTGRFAPRWTGWLALGWLAFRLPTIFLPGSSFDTTLWPPLFNGLLWLIFLGGVILIQIYRYRRVSTPPQRQQTKWVVFGISLAFGGFLTIFVVLRLLFLPNLFDLGSLLAWAVITINDLLLTLIPLSIGFAILRYRLWEIDLIINRTLVYGLLTASVVGIYVLVVGYLSLLFRTRDNFFISLLATGLVAVLFQPLRERLQRGVNRLIYGERDEPYAVLARLGERLEATLAPAAVLPTLVETVAQALKLPYVAITLAVEDERQVRPPNVAEQPFEQVEAANHGPKVSHLPTDASHQLVAVVGTPVGELLPLPLTYQREVVGHMFLAARAPGEAFSSADRDLLGILAHQAGAAAHALRLTVRLQRLTEDLQHSREQLVLAREEERRRLRRDLHDGIGPTLASLTQRLDTARRLVPREPEAAMRLLDDFKTQVRSTIAEIRRLVYALRPPVLDEFGLLSALREQIITYDQPDGLQVVLEAPEQLPPLPAAVEVAAYRIILEALTNVVKHAQAQHCLIRLWLADGLHLEVTDDGRGLSPGSPAGVGLTSMRERAAELGGECRFESVTPHGARLSVRLPLAEE